MNIVYNMHKNMQIVPVRTRDQARDALRAMIIESKILPGHPIAEQKIALKFGISRTPVREALIALEGEGLVVSLPNRGFRVAVTDAELVSEAFPIIGALEAAAIQLSGAKLLQAVPELESLIERLSKARGSAAQYRLDHAFHERLTRDCGNRRLLNLLSVERNRARSFDGYVDRGTANREGACRDHRAMVKLIKMEKYDAVATALIRHWEWGKKVVLKWMDQCGR